MIVIIHCSLYLFRWELIFKIIFTQCEYSKFGRSLSLSIWNDPKEEVVRSRPPVVPLSLYWTLSFNIIPHKALSRRGFFQDRRSKPFPPKKSGPLEAQSLLPPTPWTLFIIVWPRQIQSICSLWFNMRFEIFPPRRGIQNALMYPSSFNGGEGLLSSARKLSNEDSEYHK